MKKVVIAATLMVSLSAPAFAGSLLSAEDEFEPAVAFAGSSGPGIVPLLLGGAAVAVVAGVLSSSDSASATSTPSGS